MFLNNQEENDHRLIKNIMALAIKARPAKKNAETFASLVRPIYHHAEPIPQLWRVSDCLRQMYGQLEKYTVMAVDILNEQQEPLFVFGREPNEEYLATLKKLRSRYHDYAGVYVGFNESKVESRNPLNGTPDLWWDIEEQIIWSFDKRFMKNLPYYFRAFEKYETDIHLRGKSWIFGTDFMKF